VESEVGLGNRFTVTLPLLHNAEPPTEPLQETPATVLLVSRDTGFTQTLQELLRSEGLQVVVAAERQEVVAATPAWQPDLIIENGLEFDPHEVTGDYGAPILSLSLSTLEQRALKAGAIAVLPWPTDDTRLWKTTLGPALISDLEGEDLTHLVEAATVLVVSSNTTTLRSFDKILREAGYKRVIKATMAGDALALARRYHPNLLLVVIETGESIELFEDLHTDQLLQATQAVVFANTAAIAVNVAAEYRTGETFEQRSTLVDGDKSTVLNTLPKPLTRRRLINVVRRLASTV
jgi:CheY-like chemotaxis protein